MSHGVDQIKSKLTGISGILVTPFSDNDEIKPSGLKPIVDRAIDAGVHILVANGNTSEFYGLTMDEAEKMVYAAVEFIDGRIPLLAGVGRSIHDACRLARLSHAAGASALVIHQPPDPFVAPRGVVTYVEKIAEACAGLPLLLYLRDDGIGLDMIENLCQLPSVIGVKWACPTPVRLSEAIRRSSQEIVWVCGLAETWAPSLGASGARGFTSGLINVWPAHSVAIHNALEDRNYGLATELISVIAGFEKLRTEERNGTNVSVIKAALQITGQDCGRVRPPGAWPLTKQQEEKIRLEMHQWSKYPNAPILVR
jgi:4-hydroxy-tetrahydrodipicolinate synthase